MLDFGLLVMACAVVAWTPTVHNSLNAHQSSQQKSNMAAEESSMAAVVMSVFPVALEALLQQAGWVNMTAKIMDWLIYMAEQTEKLGFLQLHHKILGKFSIFLISG